MRSGKERRAPLSLCVALFNLRGKVQQEAASVLHHLHIETAMLIVQCASAQCDLCIGTQLCIERSDTAVAGTVRRSAHSSVTVDPGGLGSWHQPPPASPALLHNNFFSQHLKSHITCYTIARKECNMLFAPICHT